MGNYMVCFIPKEAKAAKRKPQKSDQGSSLFSRSASKKPPPANLKSLKEEQDAVIREQALAAVMLLKQYHGSNSSGSEPGSGPPLFGRSSSVVYPTPARGSVHHKPGLTRSSTARPAPTSSAFISGNYTDDQLVKQTAEIEGVETRHFVLVHGGGFGAWCWYKTMTLLGEAGFRVDAVDLTGSGVHSSDTNAVQSMAQYVKPLVDILKKLGEHEKVILVGHDFGGACVSYAMELYPSKIAKAVFITAPMPKNGQSILDVFSHQEGPSNLMRQAQVFLYGNGKDRAPTAIDLDRAKLKDLLFNQSPAKIITSAKDFVLASVSMRPIPFGPVLEKLSLSELKYGSVPRFYVETQEDCAVPVSFQEYMTDINPPEKVFRLKGSDHSPFFSKPQALHRVLVEISKIPGKQG